MIVYIFTGMLEKVGVVTALISISVSLTAYTGTFRRSRQYEGMNPFYIDAVLFLINLFNISRSKANDFSYQLSIGQFF